MNRPKYQIGDRFTVMQIVEFEIIEVIHAHEIRYLIQLVSHPIFKSLITEHNLIDILSV